ncbi:MAG: PVC-type heme-binding CxxCH protein [Pirellulales bacterium]
MAAVALAVGLGLAAGRPAHGGEPLPENSERAGAPLAPQEARAAITVRFPARVTLLASEPLIRNPVAATVDSAGRLLVAENLTYAERPLRTDTRWHDRVTLLEDADGDGVAERHAVLVDGLTGLTSVAVGRGGLWLLCPPRLLFIRDAHRPPAGWPEKPDGAEARQRTATADTVLDGFTVSPTSHHTFANGLAWGPDGWLYGRCGASSPGEIGPPGSAPGERVPLRGGMWRYHPEQRVFEAICHGTTNPWGHDWDDGGEGFFVNTVNGHLWRILPGAHYARSHTVEPHPFVTEPLGQHADHQHFDDTRHWTESRDGKADAHGGGHAHAGCVIVPDEPGWPGELRGRLLTLNLHGRRVNVDRLDHTPQGIVGRHEDDLAIFGDPFFRGTDIVELPGRALAVLDWSDTGECHEATGVHRTSGRVYRFAFPGSPSAAVAPGTDLATLDAAALVRLLAADRWHARMATRILTDRAAAGDPNEELDDVVPMLDALLADGEDDNLRLRGLWALWAIRAIDEPRLWSLLDDPAPALRRQAVRLLADTWPIDTVLGGRPQAVARPRGFTLDALERLALSETDPEVRLALACALSRLPPADRSRLARALVSVVVQEPAAAAADTLASTGHVEVSAPESGSTIAAPRTLAGDHHDLGALLFSGLLGVIPADPEGLVDVWRAARVPGADRSHWPALRHSIARRLAAADAAPVLPRLLAAAAGEGAAGIEDCLAGLVAGWRGRRRIDAPDGWEEVRTAVAAIPEDDPRTPVLVDSLARLDALFGDARGITRLVAVARDPTLPAARRAAALEALVDVGAAEAALVARGLFTEPALSPAAIRALLAAGDPADASRLVGAWNDLDSPGRDAAVATLASRAAWGAKLLDAIERGDLPRDTLSPLVARQLAGLGDAALRTRLASLVGGRDAPPGDASARIDAWRKRLPPERLAAADPAVGRAVWIKQCAACHRLHGEGGTLGPDLTGSGRRDLDYLLTNIVTPSATVSPDYRLRQALLADGRVLAGLLVRRTPDMLVLHTPTGVETIPADEVEEVRDAGVSLMPEGLLDGLSADEVRDLIGFLMTE